MSEFNTEDLDEVIASTNGSLVQMLALQLKNGLAKNTTLTSQLESVVADNAALNDKMDKLATWPGIEFYSSSWEFNSGDGNEALEFMCDVQTPATSAFLAEVRASGVEMFVKELKSAIAVDSNGSTRSRALTRIVERTSAHLRKGVQS